MYKKYPSHMFPDPDFVLGDVGTIMVNNKCAPEDLGRAYAYEKDSMQATEEGYPWRR